jgi:hypothetical protein
MEIPFAKSPDSVFTTRPFQLRRFNFFAAPLAGPTPRET